jgi:hypothetical protein
VFELFEEEIFLDVGQCLVKIVRKIVPEELLQKE